MFHVGDYVKVRDDVRPERDMATGCFYVSAMDDYKGIVLSITEVMMPDSNRNRRYKLISAESKCPDIDGWVWIDKWLEQCCVADPDDDIAIPPDSLDEIL